MGSSFNSSLCNDSNDECSAYSEEECDSFSSSSDDDDERVIDSISCNIHKNERNHKCPHAECGAAFNQRHLLKSHMANVHERPFQCGFCDKAFGTRRYLNIHIGKKHKMIRNNNGEKPFECDICFKRFRQNSDVNDHKMSKHNV